MTPTIILQSLLFGAIVATVLTLVKYFKHKPVKEAKYANEYVNKSTIKITNKHDNFVNQSVTKNPINRR